MIHNESAREGKSEKTVLRRMVNLQVRHKQLDCPALETIALLNEEMTSRDIAETIPCIDLERVLENRNPQAPAILAHRLQMDCLGGYTKHFGSRGEHEHGHQ